MYYSLHHKYWINYSVHHKHCMYYGLDCGTDRSTLPVATIILAVLCST